jgi:SAM-dependent methyltransferase
MDKRLQQVRKAYDLTVEQYKKGIDPLRNIPQELKETAFFKSFSAGGSSANSAALDIRDYLKPGSGMRFLDAGCSANLVNYRLHRWPSTYYGIDISPALIDAMKRFVTQNKLVIGGLQVAELSRLPFEDNYFDIAAAIGVLEYCPLPYIRKSLRELHRVLKTDGRAVLDVPNRDHPFVRDMTRLEKFLGRPNYLHFRDKFEAALSGYFHIDTVNDTQIMLKYFVRTQK